jgi:hypothetical protein
MTIPFQLTNQQNNTEFDGNDRRLASILTKVSKSRLWPPRSSILHRFTLLQQAQPQLHGRMLPSLPPRRHRRIRRDGLERGALCPHEEAEEGYFFGLPSGRRGCCGLYVLFMASFSETAERKGRYFGSRCMVRKAFDLERRRKT